MDVKKAASLLDALPTRNGREAAYTQVFYATSMLINANATLMKAILTPSRCRLVQSFRVWILPGLHSSSAGCEQHRML